MVTLKIILISFQIFMLSNFYVNTYIKKKITKKCNIITDDLFLQIKLNDYFKYYIFYGVFMIPFLKRISEKFIYEYNKDILSFNSEKLKLINSLQNIMNIPIDETEQIKLLKNNIRNYELRKKVKNIKRKTKNNKLKAWKHLF